MRRLALVPRFHGTNCDVETLHWLADNLDVEAAFLQPEAHASARPEDVACVVVPGGFSYGDYLRAGAIAARSDAMRTVAHLAESGVPTLGICNGFQILCEAGLLPGVLLRNANRQHNHFPVDLTTDFGMLDQGSPRLWPVWLPRLGSPYGMALREKYRHFSLPMSCGTGRYWPAPGKPARVLMRYVHNENGSEDAIAGLASEDGRIVGLMPHPERASDPLVGGTQGLLFLLGLAENTGIAIRKGSLLETFTKDFASP